MLNFSNLQFMSRDLYRHVILLHQLSPRLRYNYTLVWKNKRPPYWNSTFDFDHIAVLGMAFYIR